MSQINHIEANQFRLKARFEILRLIREFFWSNNFLEVETPNLLRLPGQEPYLNPMTLKLHDEKGNEYEGYLHTSPEYSMKKMLAAGFEKIFSICKTFRDNESFGGTHNPEFTMIEWYRKGGKLEEIMDDTEHLFSYVYQNISEDKQLSNIQIPEILSQKWERAHMRDIWNKYIKVNLDDYLEREKMFNLCLDMGFNPDPNENFENLFYLIFLNAIEPHLGKEKPLIIHHYPKQMAALATIDPKDSEYAERFEIYIGGLEIANAFSELFDEKEQRNRLEEERGMRQKNGKDVYDIDEDFINCLPKMGKSAGIALGVDRMVQLFLGCQNINDVLVLPASELWRNS